MYTRYLYAQACPAHAEVVSSVALPAGHFFALTRVYQAPPLSAKQLFVRPVWNAKQR